MTNEPIHSRLYRLQKLSKGLIAAVIGVGLLALTGWAFDIPRFKNLHPGWASMKPNTAVCLILAALAIWVQTEEGHERPLRQNLVRVFATVFTAIGTLTLLQYLSGADFGIDFLLFKQALERIPGETARMGPNSALCFVGLGTSLILRSLPQRRLRRLSGAPVWVVAILSYLAFVAYICGVSSTYGISVFTKMALHTSLCFMALAFSLSLRRADSPWLSLAIGEGAAGKAFRRSIPLSFFVPLLTLRLGLSLAERGILSLETWATFAIAPITLYFCYAAYRHAILTHQIDDECQRIAFELMQKELETRYTLSHEVSHYLAQAPAPDKAIPGLLALTCKQMGWTCAAYWNLDPEKKSLQLSSSWSASGEGPAAFLKASAGFKLKPGEGLPGRVWQTQRAQWLRDVSSDANFLRVEAAREAGLSGALAFPVMAEKDLIGVIEVFSSRVEDVDPQLLKLFKTIGTHVGIFLQKQQAEEKLREERDFSQTIIENSHDGIFAFDRDLRFTAWNAGMERLTAFERRYVIGRTASEVFPHILKSKAIDFYKRVLGGEQFHVHDQEFTSLATGKPGFCEVTWTPLLGEAKAVIGGLTVVRDITERKKAEAELKRQEAMIVHSSRMASLGEMAGGVAHEINNPLAIIGLNAERVQMCLRKPELDREGLAKAADAIENTTFRISKIVQGLRLFAHGDSGPRSLTRVRTIVDETLALCTERFHSEGVHLGVSIEPFDIELECNAQQINQVLLNLLNNAFDAAVTMPDKWILLKVSAAGPFVEFTVTDSGPGIAEHVKGKLMQPFFTTKALGKGMGLGLSIAKGIVDAHGGSLVLDSGSRNTQFVVRMPMHQAAAKAA